MSLKLLYTGAHTFDAPQNESIKSLGGYISSSDIPNGLIGNLFGDLSRYTVQLGKPEIRVFAIKNTGANKTGLKAWFTYPGGATPTNDCEFEIGFATPEVDDCGNLMTEQIASIYALPYSVVMNAGKVGEPDALALGSLDAGNYLCIFVRRKIKASVQQAPTKDSLIQILEGAVVPDKVEDIQLTFAWN